MLFAWVAGFLALAISAPANGGQLQQEAGSTLITNARVVDGTGTPARDADVRILGDRIVEVGTLEPAEGERVVDARGLVLAPGFIDSRGRLERQPANRPRALRTVGQGITTVVGGQNGISPYPIGDYLASLRRRPAAVNVAVLAGFRTLREQVRGVEGRAANAAQRVVLRAILRRELRTGALGLSVGTSMSRDTAYFEELSILAEETAAAGRVYVSSSPRIENLLAIASNDAAGIHLVDPHRAALRGGDADSLVQRLDAARKAGVPISVEVYPDTGASREAALRLLAWEHAHIASAPSTPFAWVLEHLVREQQVLPLEAAIRKMTFQVANNLGLEQRGVILPGSFADLVLFDPDVVEEPTTDKGPIGFRTVWVNGTVVLEEGTLTGRRPGRGLPGGASPAAQRPSETSAANSRRTSSYSDPASNHSPLWPAPSTQYLRFGSGAAR